MNQQTITATITSKELETTSLDHNPTRRPYLSPMLIHLEADHILGGRTHVMELTDGLMQS